MSERDLTREQAMEDIATRLYEQSDAFDPRMPELWQRSGITSSRWQSYAESFVEATPWLASFIADLPSEDLVAAVQGEGTE